MVFLLSGSNCTESSRASNTEVYFASKGERLEFESQIRKR